LVTAKLVDGKVDPKSRVVIGPLYTIDGPMGGLASSAGVSFNKEDRKALSERPFFAFGGNGELVRSVIADDRKHWADSVLKVGPKTASWQPIGGRPLVPNRGTDGNYYFESNSGRLNVEQEGDGEIHIYDRATDNRIRDQWVEAVAKDLFGRTDLQNRYVTLTEDLKFVIVGLEGDRYVRKGDKEEVFTTFTYGGKELDRGACLLQYQRPNVHPQIMEGKYVRGSMFVNDDDKLLILHKSNNKIDLHDLTDRVIVSQKGPSDVGWFYRALPGITRTKSQIIFTDRRNFYALGDRVEGVLNLAIWNFGANEFGTQSLKFADLFEARGDGYHPKKPIRVEK